jgi:hypothetical protein
MPINPYYPPDAVLVAARVEKKFVTDLVVAPAPPSAGSR